MEDAHYQRIRTCANLSTQYALTRLFALHSQIEVNDFSKFTPNNIAQGTAHLRQDGKTAELKLYLLRPGEGTGSKTSEWRNFEVDRTTVDSSILRTQGYIPQQKTCSVAGVFIVDVLNEHKSIDVHKENPFLAALSVKRVGESDVLYALPWHDRKIPRSNVLGTVATGHYFNGERFGDPLALYYPPQDKFQDYCMVIGLLELAQEDPFCKFVQDTCVLPTSDGRVHFSD
jgi:hypothetical protein